MIPTLDDVVKYMYNQTTCNFFFFNFSRIFQKIIIIIIIMIIIFNISEIARCKITNKNNNNNNFSFNISNVLYYFFSIQKIPLFFRDVTIIRTNVVALNDVTVFFLFLLNETQTAEREKKKFTRPSKK
mgnify:CR=1 FL=1